MSGVLLATDGPWSALLGWGQADLAGVSFIERVHPDDFELVIGAIHNAYASDAPTCFTGRYARRDGTYLRLVWEVRPRPGRIELDLFGQLAL